MKMVNTSLKSLRPNPHRNMANYPLRGDKVDALRESMRETGIWPNIMARKVGETFEIAYGHHRMAAATAEFGGDHQITVVVDDFSDLVMLQLMARENLETYTTEFRTLLETWEAAVIAASQGLFGTVTSKAPKGCSIYKNHDSLFRYDVDFIAKKLGWTTKSRASNAAAAASAALELVTHGHMHRDDFNGLTARDAMNLTVTAREKMRQIEEAVKRKVLQPTTKPEDHARIKAEGVRQVARVGQVAKQVAKEVVGNTIAKSNIRAEVTGRVFRDKEAREVLADEYVKHTTARVSRFFDADSDTGKRFVEIIKAMPLLETADRREVEKLELALNHMSDSAKSTSKSLSLARMEPGKNVVALKAVE